MLITIEGIDCSGKETQRKRLVSRLKAEGIKVEEISYPCYDSPTGKIIAGPYLGKDGHSFFDNPPQVEPLTASLFFAADRTYNRERLLTALKNNDVVILDRYVFSNMAHQGCKLDGAEREEFFSLIEKLEFDLLGLPKPELVLFLHLPVEIVEKLLNERAEQPDAHERDRSYLKRAEETYLQLAEKYGFVKINCENSGKIDSAENIAQKVFKAVKEHERKNSK